MERELKQNNDALDKAAEEFDVAEKQADEFGDEVKDTGKDADEAGGKFEKLGGVLKGVGVAVGAAMAAIGTAAVAAGKKLYDMANDVAEAGDAIDKTSQKIGISAESYQEWDYVFQHCGADVNNLQSGMKKLSGVITDAADGSDSAAQKLSAVRFSIEDLNGKSQDEQLSVVISALQKMESGAVRTTAANDLLGKSAVDMAAVLNMTAEETEALKQEAQDYGMAMSNEAVAASAAFEDSLTKMKGTMCGLKNRMVGELLPGITMIMDGLSDLVAGNEQAVEELTNGVTAVIETVTEMIPQAVELISLIASAILESAPSIIRALAEGIINAIPILLHVVLQVITELVTALMELLPQIVNAGMQILASLITGIATALPTLIPQIVEVVVQIVQTLVDNLPLILDAALQLITGLAEGILNAIPVLIDALPEVILSIVDFLLDSIPQIIETGIQLLTSLVEALPTIIMAIVEAIPKIIDGIINAVINAIPLIIEAGIKLLVSLIQALPQIIVTIVKAIPQIISGIVDALIGNIDKIIMAGVDLFVVLIENLPTIIVEIVKAVPQIIAGIVKAFGSLMDKIVEIGGNIVKGLSGYIEDNGDEAVRAAEGMATDIDGVMNDLAHDMQTTLPTDFDVTGNVRFALDGAGTFGGFTIALNIINFNNYSSEDIRQLTNEVMETANQFAILSFVKTAECGSFTKAAELLNYSQSSISRMINDLEKEWKVALLERSVGGVKLTSDSMKLLPYAKSVVIEFEKLQMEVEELNRLRSGLIRIGTFSSVATHWLPNIIKEFQKAYPNIDYELLLGDYTEIEEWILEGRVDCGFLRLPTHPEFETIFLEQDKLMAIIHENHRLADCEKFPVAALCDDPFMLLEKGAKAEVSEIFERCGLTPKVHFTTWDDYAIMSMVESGLGSSILPQLILKRVPYKIIAKELDVSAYRNIGLALRSKKTASLAVKRFLDYLEYR